MDKSKFVVDYLKSQVNLLYHKALSEHETSKKCHRDTVQAKQRSHSVSGHQDKCSSYNYCLNPDQKFQHSTADARERPHTAVSLQDQRVFCKDFPEQHQHGCPQSAEIKKRSYSVTDLQVQRSACMVYHNQENQNTVCQHLLHSGDLLTSGHSEHNVRSENVGQINISLPNLKLHFSRSTRSENIDGSYLSSKFTTHNQNSRRSVPTKISQKESRKSLCVSKIHNKDNSDCKSARFSRTAEAIITRNDGVDLNVDDRQAIHETVLTDRNKGILLLNSGAKNLDLSMGITLPKKIPSSSRSVLSLNLLDDSKSCHTNSDSRSKETISGKTRKEKDARISSSETKWYEHKFTKSQSGLDENIYKKHCENDEKHHTVSKILNHKQEFARQVLASPHDRCLQDAANLEDVVFYTSDEGLTATAPVEELSMNALVESSAVNAPVESSAVTEPVKSLAVTASVEGSTVTAPVKDSTLTTSVESSTVTVPVEGLTVTALVEGLKETAPVKKGSTVTAPVEGSTMTSPVEGLTETAPVKDLALTSPVEDSALTSHVTDLTSIAPVCDLIITSTVDNLTVTTPVEKLTLAASIDGLNLTSPDDKAVPAIHQDKMEQSEKTIDVPSPVLLPLTIENVGQLPRDDHGQNGTCDSDNNSNKSYVIQKKGARRIRNEKTDDQTKEKSRKRKRHRSRDSVRKRPTLQRACTVPKKTKKENSTCERWTTKITKQTHLTSPWISKRILSGARQQKAMPNKTKKGHSTKNNKGNLDNKIQKNKNRAKSLSIKGGRTRLAGEQILKSEKFTPNFSQQKTIQQRHEDLLRCDTTASIDKLNCLERKTLGLQCVIGDIDVNSTTSDVNNVMPLVDVTRWSNGNKTYRISSAVSSKSSDSDNRQHPGGIWKSIFQEN